MKYLSSRCIGRAFSFFLPAFIVFFLSLIATAQVNNYYVSPSGSDANDGSQTRPWKTIQHGIDSSSIGSQGVVIHVAAGTYSDIHTVNACAYTNTNFCVDRSGPSASARFRVQCDAQWSVPSGSGCLLRGSALTGVANIGNNVDVAGFDIGNVPGEIQGMVAVCTNPTANGPCASANSTHFINNYVHDIAQTAVDSEGHGAGCPGSGAILGQQHHGSSLTDFRVIGNRVSHYANTALSPANGGGCRWAHGIYVNTPGAMVQNNVVLDSSGYGIHYYSAPCNGVISNNTVVRSGISGIVVAGGDVCGSGVGKMTITNNISDVSPNYGIQLGSLGGSAGCTSSTPVLISNNITNGNAGGSVGQTNSCSVPVNQFNEAPTATFVNYVGNSNDDYHLKSGSIAVDQGATVCVAGGSGCLATIDFDGLARSTPPSIGVFELSTASGSAPSAPVGLTASVQ